MGQRPQADCLTKIVAGFCGCPGRQCLAWRVSALTEDLRQGNSAKLWACNTHKSDHGSVNKTSFLSHQSLFAGQILPPQRELEACRIRVQIF